MAESRALEFVRYVAAENIPDAELLLQFRELQDESAFTELIRRHERAVRSAAARVLQTQADIDDTTQATFLVLLQRASTLDGRTGIGAWLFGVAHRTAMRVRKHNRLT